MEQIYIKISVTNMCLYENQLVEPTIELEVQDIGWDNNRLLLTALLEPKQIAQLIH